MNQMRPGKEITLTGGRYKVLRLGRQLYLQLLPQAGDGHDADCTDAEQVPLTRKPPPPHNDRQR